MSTSFADNDIEIKLDCYTVSVPSATFYYNG